MAKEISVRVRLLNAMQAGAASAVSSIKAMGASIRANLTAASIAAGAFAASVLAAGKQVVAAFIEAEDAQKGLAAALRNNGDNAAALVPKFTALATAIQNQTKFEDDAVVSAMALGRNMGITSGNLEKATVAAVGLASKYRIDLQTAMTLVAKASQGQTETLSRYGMVLDDTLTPQEKFNAVLKQGADAFGLAQDEAKTTGGQIAQLGNIFGDLKEDIGGAIVETGLLQKAMGWLRAKMDELKASGAIQRWADNIKVTFEKLVPIVVGFGRILQNSVGRVAGFAGALAGGAGIKEAWAQSGELLKQQSADVLAIDRETQQSKQESAIATIEAVKQKELDAAQEIKKGKVAAEKEAAKAKVDAIEDAIKAEEKRVQEAADLQKAILKEEADLRDEMIDKVANAQKEQAKKDEDAAKEKLATLGFNEDNEAELQKKLAQIKAKQARGIRVSKRDQAILAAAGERENARNLAAGAQKALELAEQARHQKRLDALRDMKVELQNLNKNNGIDLEKARKMLAEEKRKLDDIEKNTKVMADAIVDSLSLS